MSTVNNGIYPCILGLIFGTRSIGSDVLFLVTTDESPFPA